MRTNQIYIARDGKSGMHVLVRILAVDDIGKDYLPIDPDDFNKLMMARDVRSLVLAARDLGPMYISADILSRRIFIPSHLQQHIEHGVNLVPSDLESLLSECYFDPYAIPVETPERHLLLSVHALVRCHSITCYNIAPTKKPLEQGLYCFGILKNANFGAFRDLFPAKF